MEVMNMAEKRHNDWEYQKKRKLILAKFKYKCVNCGSVNRDELNVHHIVPLSVGGTNKDSNLVVLCNKCHMAIHFSKHRNLINPCPNAKRPCFNTDNYAETIFEKYFSGEIGTKKLKELMGYSSAYRITDSPQFKKYKADHKITTYRNNIDIVLNRSKAIRVGQVVGYVNYENGNCKTMYYCGEEVIPSQPEEVVEEVVEVQEIPDSKTLEKLEAKAKLQIAFEENKENIYSLYDDYFTGVIGTNELKHRISCSHMVKGINNKICKQYMEDHKIKYFQSEIDVIIKTRGFLSEGDVIGHIFYTDGREEQMIYK